MIHRIVMRHEVVLDAIKLETSENRAQEHYCTLASNFAK